MWENTDDNGPGEQTGNWSIGEIVRAVRRVERRQREHEQTHVSKEAFDSLRSTLGKLAWLIVAQVFALVGALVYLLISRVGAG